MSVLFPLFYFLLLIPFYKRRNGACLPFPSDALDNISNHGPFRDNLPAPGEHSHRWVGIYSLIVYPSCAPTHRGSTGERISRVGVTSTNSSDEYFLTYSSKAVHQRIVLAVVAAIATLSVLAGTAWMTSQILQLAAWVSDNTRIPARESSG